MNCPKCGTKCEAEHVDIGVGEQRIEPWGCPNCLWVEPSAEDEFDMDIGEDPGEECGRWRNGRLTNSCTKFGSEECDWECPYRGSMR